MEVSLRWIELAGILSLSGGLGFGLLVSAPALTGKKAGEGLRLLGARLDSRLVRLLWLSLAVLLAALGGRLFFQAAVTQRVRPDGAMFDSLGAVLASSNWGSLWLWKAGLLLAVALTLVMESFFLSRVVKKSVTNGSVRKVFRTVALAITMSLLFPFSLEGHLAALTDLRFAAATSNYVHLLAAGFWAGGLLHFAAGMPLLHRAASAERRAALLALAPRFSALATLGVATLLVTGSFNAWVQVTDIAEFMTRYGLTLSIKLSLLVLLFFTGAFKRLWLIPALSKDEHAGLRLHKLLNREVLLAALVILSVAVLTGLEPPKQLAVVPPATKSHPLGFYVGITGFTLLLLASATGYLMYRRKLRVPVRYHADLALIALGVAVLHSIFATVDRFFPVP